jgi:ribosomal protein S18 acetylase RimI-like enzyme
VTVELRHLRASDGERALGAVDHWWGQPALGTRLPQVLFSRLSSSSFVLEASDGLLVGFLLRFYSEVNPAEACVYLAGVHPQFRRLGFGRRLYERFFAGALMHQRRFARAVAPASDPGAMAFHRAMGFVQMERAAGDYLIAGSELIGSGEPYVVFVRAVSHQASRATSAHRLPT